MARRPCGRLGDLVGLRLAGDDRHIRNPHEHLEVRPYDVKVRRPVIVGVDTQAHRAKAM